MRIRPTFLAVVLTLSALSPLFASPEPDTGTEPMEQRISIKLQNANAAEVFQSFGKLMGMEAVVDPAVRGKISIVLENVRVRTALEAACESLDCRWKVQDGSPRKLAILPSQGGDRKAAAKTLPTEPIDLKVTDAELRDLLTTFGQMVSAEVVLDPELTGKVTLSLENTPWNEALDTVCKRAGCEWSLSEGDKKILKVTAKGGARPPEGRRPLPGQGRRAEPGRGRAPVKQKARLDRHPSSLGEAGAPGTCGTPFRLDTFS
jgi:type II secretory pathway component GspD/PulD (secretin)